MSKRKNPHAVALGRKGGRVMTPKKLAAIQRNARLGGRKPKFAPGDQIVATDAAPQYAQGQRGTIIERADRARYRVQLEATAEPVTLFSWWMQAV